MIKQIQNPCHQRCPERTATCHAGCGRYAQYDEYRQQIREARQKDHDTTDALIRGAMKIKKEKFRRQRNNG